MIPAFLALQQRAATDGANKLLSSGADHEFVLRFLRDKGFDKIDSIKALVTVSGMPLREAKAIVHNSEAWSDTHDRDERFTADMSKAVVELE